MYSEAKAELIQAAKQSEEAFIELYQLYVQRVFRFALSRTRNQQLAEDITSETFLTLLNKLHTYTPTGAAFSSWLFQIALNHIRTHWRKEKSPPLDIDSLADLIPSASGNHKDWLDLFLALDHLLEDDRNILLMKYVDDLPNQKIAEILKISPNSCTVRIHRAKERAQTYLQTYDQS
ncbi:MAG: hypothetical protein COW24_00855 [Candidatus Kerfeldbacteria bacterium CG15_BIG_FIL_POST_REV_8_21_14_020_45_12]|uniref:RNA polymerase subunit sigma-24 n=1 Tax=Candidatus Kerfeldbacteria bacterium CG15_BIG_FIL_POST_REV_8_21_14_020_45_12 TaxID=2014247 RepID=A0A2M7H514_9BACT|nr:MAG: hypothetical protein COW24_00855 [Candidatus Kerfeldbacteria bacterium CG15_BIG_FIL_POST_REV_8_21_14_020_45_12]PJA93192.1 MAG: hypothetical protein CO132_04390 [Candidatus Kerfeldbacteria bacterium CG_4_9_14_3_um_filter_45_8]